MNIYRITRLSRPFDLSQTSNRIGMFGPVLVGLISVGWDLASGDPADLLNAARASITAFLAWAIARELDPDRSGTASLSMALAAIAALSGLWEMSLAISAAALLGLRVLVGTVGGNLRRGDLIVFVGLAVFAGTRIEGWVIVLLLVLGLLDSRPPDYVYALPVMLVGAGLGGYLAEVGLPGGSISDEVYLWALITVAAIPLAARRTRIRSRTDIYDHPIAWPNVRAARVMAGFVVIGGLLASDASTVVLLVPVLAALVATALTRTFRAI